jgi:hypothetical protein
MQPSVRIPPNHLRVLQTGLAGLEGLLLRLERALREPPLLGYLYREMNPLLNHPRAGLIWNEVATLRGELRRLGTKLGLGVSENDRLGEFRSRLAVLWVDLEELRPQRLAGYGPVSPELADELEVGLERLKLGIKRLEAGLDEAGEAYV